MKYEPEEQAEIAELVTERDMLTAKIKDANSRMLQFDENTAEFRFARAQVGIHTPKLRGIKHRLAFVRYQPIARHQEAKRKREIEAKKLANKAAREAEWARRGLPPRTLEEEREHRQREVYQMREGGMTFIEIAERFAISPPAARNIYVKASKIVERNEHQISKGRPGSATYRFLTGQDAESNEALRRFFASGIQFVRIA